MAAELILAPEAEQDILKAYNWYENRRPGLGEEFLRCLDASLEQIRRMPEIHAKVHQEYRRALIRRFPYAVFYEYGASGIVVYSVFHTSRDPARWRERLP